MSDNQVLRAVNIQGQSVAAFACAHLLRHAGLPVISHGEMRPRLPAILVSEATLALARDVFDRPALFRNAHVIRRRAVLWSRDAEPLVLDHRAIALPEADLFDSLARDVSPGGHPGGWTVFASRPLPGDAREYPFGSRIAASTRVSLRKECGDTCSIESFAEGWLFLIPESDELGILLSVGATPAELLRQSRLIAPQVSGLRDAVGDFPCSPRIVWPLGGSGWLACGTAAMAFDPICGDGTGNAIREAILASAVIRALAAGEPEEHLLEHYHRRLIAGFYRHQMLSRQFYGTGYGGPWWEDQVNALNEGLIWCQPHLQASASFRYRLDGFELKRIV